MSGLSVVNVWQSLFDVTLAVRGRSGDVVQFTFTLSGKQQVQQSQVNSNGCAFVLIDQFGNSTIRNETINYNCRFKPLPGTTSQPVSTPATTSATTHATSGATTHATSGASENLHCNMPAVVLILCLHFLTHKFFETFE
ncbi:hypothetical protein Bpfe_007055 [Biomphalaria pfeifferi]|uniref:Uncharacterized protein n=1 Tax=Biomphalaria pfeifferi TaxID=112525 RepID=A0AAD8C0Z4_BIOPF|nr:hypothetical protein Bpfe_007055 [Biomphalaria pfeifferi]